LYSGSSRLRLSVRNGCTCLICDQAFDHTSVDAFHGRAWGIYLVDVRLPSIGFVSRSSLHLFNRPGGCRPAPSTAQAAAGRSSPPPSHSRCACSCKSIFVYLLKSLFTGACCLDTMILYVISRRRISAVVYYTVMCCCRVYLSLALVCVVTCVARVSCGVKASRQMCVSRCLRVFVSLKSLVVSRCLRVTCGVKVKVCHQLCALSQFSQIAALNVLRSHAPCSPTTEVCRTTGASGNG
jgi:hypothetical protein